MIVVTGSNKGIGKGIVRHLALQAKEPTQILLTSRRVEAGKEAIQDIEKVLPKDTKNQLLYHQLDITDEKSIQTFADDLKSQYGDQCIDILVDNAGYASPPEVFDKESVHHTLNVNYFGTKNVTLKLLPLIKPNGRVIAISSSIGKLNKLSPELQKQFSNTDLTLEQLDKLEQDFDDSVADGTYEQKGYPKHSYAVSKIGVTALIKVLNRMYKNDPRHIFFAACCPGWVRTDMGTDKAALSIDEGVQTPVYLALSDDDTIKKHNGEFWFRKTVDSW